MPPDPDRPDDQLDREFGRSAIHQVNRFLARELTRPQLYENLRALADRHGVADRIDWDDLEKTPEGFN